MPVFLRIIHSAYRTDNNKQLKAPLIQQGIDPDLLPHEDKIYRLVSLGSAQSPAPNYVPYTIEDWEDLKGGRLSL